MNIVESFVVGGGLSATGELRSRVIYALLRQLLIFEALRAEKVGVGWGEQRERYARARAATNLARDPETSRPFRARAHISVFNPSPIFSVQTPARARLGALSCARALLPFSVPRLRLPRPREVQLGFVSHWLASPPFFPVFGALII